MRVKRIICPSCKSEKREPSDENNMHGYSEEIVSEICGKDECKEWFNSPEQKLLRALLGVKE